jgi:Family of unknown function (UPF0738)
MRKMIEINDISVNDKGLFLKIDTKPINFAECYEIGTMIADSDKGSLLYIIEEKEEFVYLTVPVKFWSEIKKASDQNLSVFLQAGEDTLELVKWNEELTYLVQNVKGNFNYGEEFVKQIQNVFS